MSNRTRAFRRSKTALKKQQRAKYGTAGYWYRVGNEHVTARTVGIVARTPSPCGCWMCANPRKVFGVPFADIRRKLQYTGGEE